MQQVEFSFILPTVDDLVRDAVSGKWMLNWRKDESQLGLTVTQKASKQQIITFLEQQIQTGIRGWIRVSFSTMAFAAGDFNA